MKVKTIYVCSKCYHEEPRWYGKCPDCQSWNTMEQQEKVQSTPAGAKTQPSISDNLPPRKITDVQNKNLERFSSSISELDRVLGGGIVRGSVAILSAEPGAGKSTLYMQTANNLANAGYKVLYCSGEESEEQLSDRGTRLCGDKLSDNLYIKSETCMNNIKLYVEKLEPQVLIIDSIQTIYLNEYLPSSPGGKTQSTACMKELVAIAKGPKKIPVFIVGQVTKANELAGVRELEHVVDTVMHLEGDRCQQVRILKAVKNRFGTTDEIGIFEMTSEGLEPITNPSDVFITKRDKPAIGCTVTTILEGTRVLTVEIESLVDQTHYATPMRVAEGIKREQLQVLSAILEKRAGITLNNKDVYIKVTGGLKLNDPAVNLGILMAIASSCKGLPITGKTVFVGEVGLTGELKKVPQIEKRINEISKLGYSKVVIPKNSCKKLPNIKGLEIQEFETIKEIMNIFSKASPKKKKSEEAVEQ